MHTDQDRDWAREMHHRVTALWQQVVLPKHLYPMGLTILAVDGTMTTIRFWAEMPDNFSGLKGLQYGKLWVVTADMSDQVILNTIYQAYETYQLHEIREQFLVAGKPIFMNKH